MNALHVAFLVPHLGGGGAEMNALRLANALSRAGARVSMLAVRGGGPYEPQLDPGVASVHLGRRLPSTTLALACAIPALRGWLRRERPDVLVPVMDLTSLAALVACRGLDPAPRVALSIQNNPDAKLREGLVMRWTQAATLRWYPRSDAIVALSGGVASVLARRLPSLAPRITMIPNIGVTAALDEGARQQVEEAPAPGRALIVAVGRLVEQKGYPHLLDAMALLGARGADAELWILGKGPLEEDLKRRAGELGVGDRVRFLGFRPNPWAYMARADLFVLSSLWEGFGNVVVEAMAAGAPVVSADCPYGPGEIIEDGVSGRLVRPGDAQALADAMREALADGALRARWAEAGRRRAENYRDTAVAARWLELFERLRAA